jgi:hypothetical protein
MEVKYMRSLPDVNRSSAVSSTEHLPQNEEAYLRYLMKEFRLSIAKSDLIRIDGTIYVTHSALLRLAKRKHCHGIRVAVLLPCSNPDKSRWVVHAIVFPKRDSPGFSGYGDADPSNVPPGFHGCELRIAETRAVNRALRKAYGIGLCSIEELSSPPPTPTNGAAQKQPKPAPLQEVVSAIPLRDQLRQLIRQHQLDPALVKQYALEHCRVKNLRQATREQVASFVKLLAERVTADRETLVADLQRFVISSKDESNHKEAA